MNLHKDMTPMQRIEALKKSGITLFPHLTQEQKRVVMFIKDEPVISAKRSEPDHCC
ncbi:hypothetical protein [Pantoea ananatis]|uniref:hypothetical protein n=1 Tax=Pantoea TaxID=53335 RepID=UPI0015E2C193|nr:hypothetical protein [Pantoea ananatis]